MDKALAMCYDRFVSYELRDLNYIELDSERFWIEYNVAKSNSENLWDQYRERYFKLFYRNDKVKQIHYGSSAVVGVLSFGIFLFPALFGLLEGELPNSIEKSNDTEHKKLYVPSYGTLIEFCKKKEGQFLDEKEVANIRKAYLDEQIKAQIEQEKKLQVEEKRERQRELKIIKDQKIQKQENGNYAKNLGYSNGMTYGIISTISKVISGTWSKNNAAKYLITINGYDDFRVKNVIDDYVIFSTFRNYDLIQIAVIKEVGEDYITNSILKGKYFAVVGTQTFTNTLGQNMEVLVFKKIK